MFFITMLSFKRARPTRWRNWYHISLVSCVMDSGIQSDFFASHVGVRQGENLSPLLFALFLNDLDTFFTKQKWDKLIY